MSINEWYDRVPEPYRFIICLVVTCPIWSLLWWKNYPTVLTGCGIYTVLFVFAMIPRIIRVHRGKRRRAGKSWE